MAARFLLILVVALMALAPGEAARKRYSRPSIHHQPQVTYKTVRTYSKPSYIQPSFSRPSYNQPSRTVGGSQISRSGRGYSRNRGQTVTYGTSSGHVRKVVIDGGFGNGGFINNRYNHGAYIQGHTQSYNKGPPTYGHHNPQPYIKSHPKIYGHAQQTHGNTPQRYGDSHLGQIVTPQVVVEDPQRFNDDVQLPEGPSRRYSKTQQQVNSLQKVRPGAHHPAGIHKNNNLTPNVIPAIEVTPPSMLAATFAPPVLPPALANSVRS